MFINVALVKFDIVSFMVNAVTECLELLFAKIDTDKMKTVIQEILKWDAFTKYLSRFYVTVDKDTSRFMLFDFGYRKSPNQFKSYFQKCQMEVTLIEK